MKLMDALRNRRGTRDFRPDPVNPEVLRELVEAATLAPSYMNLQPWSFSIVAEPETVGRFSRLAKEFLNRSLDAHSPFFPLRQEISAPSHELFYSAPALIVISAKFPGNLADAGCAMAAFALMLAAHGAGLASCCVSTALPWLESREGRAALGIPRAHRPLAPIIVGAPAGEPVSPGRFTPEIVWLPNS